MEVHEDDRSNSGIAFDHTQPDTVNEFVSSPRISSTHPTRIRRRHSLQRVCTKTNETTHTLENDASQFIQPVQYVKNYVVSFSAGRFFKSILYHVCFFAIGLPFSLVMILFEGYPITRNMGFIGSWLGTLSTVPVVLILQYTIIYKATHSDT